MSEFALPTVSSLTSADALLVEELCTRFEDACQKGEQPRIEDYQHEISEAAWPVLLGELLMLDVEYRRCPGSRIGPYKLLQKIGEGGMGVVWMAERQEPVRHMVALKVIKPGMDSGQVIARFEAERQALALMDHPNIAKVFDAGTTAHGRPYFVMELVKGIPITTYCDQHQLMPKERLELFMPVCHAIHHAHQKGIIHRDIKPGNVLVARFDDYVVPKVIDFGVAKAIGQKLTDKTLFSGFGSLIGTLEYMSPEQAQFNAQDIDTRSDIYALGVLLYELLTGTTPMTRQRLEKAAIEEALRLIREEDPPKPSTRLSSSDDLPSLSANRKTEPAKLMKLICGELDCVVMTALDKVRTRRYDTAAALARDIDHYLHDEPVERVPPSVWYRFRKTARRNKAAVMTAALVAATLLLGIVGITWQAVRALQAEEAALSDKALADDQRKIAEAAGAAATKSADAARESERFATEQAKAAESARKKADEAASLEKATRERAEFHLATSTMMLARSRYEENNVALADDLLEQVPRSYRSTAWGILKNYVAGPSLFSLNGHTSNVNCVSFSPDGAMLASASSDRTVRLWDAKSGQELRVLKGHTSSVLSVSFSPDGAVLASASEDTTVRLWDTKSSGQELRVLKGHTSSVLSVSFSPDGAVLASASSDKTVRLWDAKSGQEPRVLKGHTNYVRSVSFSPDGAVLASASQDSTVRLWDAKSGQELRVLKGHTTYVTSVSFGPDGAVLASASEDKTVRLWDAKSSGQELRVLKHTIPVRSVSFSPDGAVLASASDDKTVRLWDAKSSAQELRVLKGHTSLVRSMSFSPDGAVLASASSDKTVRLWDAKSGQELRVLKHTIPVRSVSFSPDGAVLASASDDKTVRLWDAKSSAQELRVLKGHTSLVRSMSFSPDGAVLASASSDKTVRLWDAKSGQELRVLKGHTTYVTSVSFSPDGAVLASASGDKTVRLWDAKSSGQELRVLKGHTSPVRSVSFSPDGAVLASASSDRTVRLWDAKSGQELRVLKGHTTYVTSVSFSPDGAVLASASGDKTVRLWDAKSGQELRVLKGHTSYITSVSFSPDGAVLASASLDNTVRLWAVRSTWTPPGEPLTPAELAYRRWVTGPVPQWHMDKRIEAEQSKNTFAAAFHRSWEQHARGVLAFERGDFQMANAHFIAAAALKPMVPPTEK